MLKTSKVSVTYIPNRKIYHESCIWNLPAQNGPGESDENL